MGHPPIVSYDLGICLSPHLRVPHNSLAYIKHYFPRVLVSNRIIKLRENQFQEPFFVSIYSFFLSFLYKTLNEASFLDPRVVFALVALGGKKETIFVLNFKVKKKSNDSPLPTCLREWVAKLFMIKSTLRFGDLKFTSRLIIQLLTTFDVIHAIWFAITTHNLLAIIF